MTDDGPFDDLARRLTTPAVSGVYLARNEIVLLARLEDASLRVGERRRMLVDVLKSAQGPADLDAVLARLAAFVADSLASYRRLAGEFPAAADLLAPWIERATRTDRALAELREDVAAATPTGG